MDVQGSWVPAVWNAFKARAITRSGRDVLLTLRTFRGARGLIYPSHARLAARVGCCVSTVQAALVAGREAGLVAWTSGRLRRTSNRYTLELPRDAPRPRTPRRVERAAMRATRALVGERRREGENPFRKELTGGRMLAPHPPVRTPAEQLAILAGWETEKREAAWSTALSRTRSTDPAVPMTRRAPRLWPSSTGPRRCSAA